MKTQRTLRNIALAILLSAITSSTLHAGQGDQIWFSGRILVDGASTQDIHMYVETATGEQVPFVLRPGGTFRFALDTGVKATMRITKPGYFTKEIALDSHHALCTPRTRRIYKRIRFDVQMEEGLPDLHQFAGPVGSIAFEEDSGHMLVEYDSTMISLPEPDVADLYGK